MPANKQGIAEKLQSNAIPCLSSVSLCLEDSIADDALEQAEEALKRSLDQLLTRGEAHGSALPLLFVRVRSAEHLEKVHRRLGDAAHALTGYILPKFDLSNADAYCSLIPSLTDGTGKHFYCMPILESRRVANLSGRSDCLYALREKLNAIEDHVLNIRVGGNDFCNLFGIRRAVHQNIWQVGLVRDIFVDILNVFSENYLVSGPVWEYFGANTDEPWAKGLQSELELDRLNGFVGKTAIHPSQLPIIWEAMKVSRADWIDAARILDWNGGDLAVARGEGRMNEVKCHTRWAQRISALGRIYGVRD